MKGLRKYLTPFAPDQSGAETVLYRMGGIIVILDAGGCTGNICGFDEPRWSETRSAVFSAGLRDMDAIMGRDELLVKKLESVTKKVDAKFIAIVGTPVPSVIGTDYHALRRLVQRKVKCPVLCIPTDGMHTYEKGEEEAYVEMFRVLCGLNEGASEEAAAEAANASSAGASTLPRVGVLGASPLDLPWPGAGDQIREALRAEGFEALLYGEDATLDDVRAAVSNAKNVVVAPAGLKAAEYLNKHFGTPYEVCYPGSEALLDKLLADAGVGLESAPKKILVIHQQVLANEIREDLRKRLGGSAQDDANSGKVSENAPEITVGSWFNMRKEDMEKGDIRLKEEDDFMELIENGQYDMIFCDDTLKPMAKNFAGSWISFPEFAVSGKYDPAK